MVPRGQRGAAIAIIVIHSVLLAMIVAVAVRLGSVIVSNPGFVPVGNGPDDASDEIRRPHRTGKQLAPPASKEGKADFVDRAAIIDGITPSPPGLEDFARRDVYVCEPDGLPPFCRFCWNWKPDRTHHNRMLGRCVRRLDHYCPWYVAQTSLVNRSL